MEHVAHACREIGPFGEKIRFVSAFDKTDQITKIAPTLIPELPSNMRTACCIHLHSSISLCANLI